jgi:preprotein translocase SecE subunit
MARDRQSAKRRQAERRARRLASEGEEATETQPRDELSAERDAAAADELGGGDPSPRAGSADLAARPPGPDGQPEPHLAVNAPPEELGHSDAVIEDEPQLEDYDPEDEEQPLDGDEAYAPRGRRGGAADAAGKDRPRLVQFLMNSWAELQRVQWPNRQQLITLTWVVLGFVLIAGGYLGLLDAIFSRLVQALL